MPNFWPEKISGPMHRLAPAVVVSTDASTRQVSYVLSDQSVARDNHRIMTAGWDINTYKTNPVFLWAHDDTEPPIGRMDEIGVVGEQLRGTVEYVDPDISAFADMIFRMVKERFINAVSVSWRAIDWKFSTDEGRPGGIDFLRSELLEVSQVPLPCLASALATARAAGIDTSPLVGWAEKILDRGDVLLVPRAELEEMRRVAQMPKPARRAVADRGQIARRELKRDLHDCGWLAMLLCDLDWLQECCEFETEAEGDHSPIAERLAEQIKALGAILVDMTAEEVAELVEDNAAPDEPEMDEEPRAVVAKLLRRVDLGAASAIVATLRAHLRGDRVTFAVARGEPVTLTRTGRVLSGENERCLRDAHDMMTRGCDMVRSVFEQVDPEENPDDADPEQGDGDEEEKKRRLRARKAKLAAARSKHRTA